MKKLICCLLFINILIHNAYALDSILNSQTKFPNISSFYVNDDKYEKFNRRIFYFNLKLNKIFVKRIHTIWTSLFPKVVIDCLNYAYINIEYPKRAVSCILQRDFEGLKHETKRFIINTTFGLAGLFDFANKIFNMELYNEDMEQALTSCKVKCGSYLVLPFVSSVTSRDITGRLLDFILTPTTYIASPVAAAVKMGLLINRTVNIQPIIKVIESNFADPYDIAKKVYGVEKYIKQLNYDRKNVIEHIQNDYDQIELVDNTKDRLDVKGKISDNLYVKLDKNEELAADIFLNDFNSQGPVLDSIRTVLLVKQKRKNIWADDSIWNRTFDKKLKTACVEICPNRCKYRYKYLLQKSKSSPLAIIFPSVGESADSSHNIYFANMFYNEGYSVILLGSHFQWEFLKSIFKGYKIGKTKDDIKLVNRLIDNIVTDLSNKYNRSFLSRVAFGTSLGGYCVMFLANNQYDTNANNIDRFIAVCPPYSLLYAADKIDKITESWKIHSENFQDTVAVTAAKVMRAYNNREKFYQNFSRFPFSLYEAKLICGFVFHQKLSDLIYQIETDGKEKTEGKKDLYNLISSMNFKDYIDKYILVDYTLDELANVTDFSSIENYLINKDNYKIFHSLDDYLISKEQLRKLKSCCDDKLVLFSNGAHLGFMYRDEFLKELKNELSAIKKQSHYN